MRQHRPIVAVAKLEPELQAQSDAELLDASRALQYRAKCGERPARLLVAAFALVREAARRRLGLRHHDVQIQGGIALARGAVAEMQTGEGKTLTAAPPLYLYALAGKGAHLVTANPYLARRDADWMRPVFEALGTSVGVVLPDSTPEERRAAYRCDITYGTVGEIGFDFLRDRLAAQPDEFRRFPCLFDADDEASERGRLQRRPYFALVDEADSVLIDDARTPLIISAPGTRVEPGEESLLRWAAAVARELQDGDDFFCDPATRVVSLTETGRTRIRRRRKPPEMNARNLIDVFEAVERAVAVRLRFHLDRQYVVRDGEAVIVDENTGRPAEGRTWRGGIHQAVEAKEGLAISPPTNAAAGVTVQSLIRRYPLRAGLTATASASALELRQVYGLKVVPIPTHARMQRRELPARCFATRDEKLAAVLHEVRQMHDAGRPVLIGTRSITASHELSERLVEAGLSHNVLNARNIAAEAEIVARAGESGGVTVATNMAGRGTDIQLDAAAREAGGLHVVATELHDSERIDRQLYGRCGRQGDPGSYRQFLSLEDDVLRDGLPDSEFRRLPKSAPASESSGWLRLFRKAQRNIERRHRVGRNLLLHLDDRRTRREAEMGLDVFLETVD